MTRNPALWLLLALLISVLANAFAIGGWSRAHHDLTDWQSLAVRQDTELVQQDEALKGAMAMLQQCSDLWVSGK